MGGTDFLARRPRAAVIAATRRVGGFTIVAATLVAAGAFPGAAMARRQQEPAACETQVTFGVIDARSACFVQEGTAYASSGPVRINGITINPLSAGQPLRVDPVQRTLSVARIQLRIGPIVVFQGDLKWTVPEGDRVTLAEFDLATRSRIDAPPSDTEASSDLAGDDSSAFAGIDLKGKVKLELAGGATILTGTVELPNVLTDAEGHGLTGTIQVTADNDRGLRLSGVRVRAPRAFIGRLEVQNLTVSYSGDGNSDATATCNSGSPGLRFDGTADLLRIPTPTPLELRDVGIGFADGAFSYGRATWVAPPPGRDIGGLVRVQRVTVSVCAGPPVKLEGRVALTALPGKDGEPALTIPDAGLVFEGGDPWSLRAEAPQATLIKGGREYRFTDLSVRYTSTGAIDFGAAVSFSLPLGGELPGGPLDGVVNVEARAQGFIERDRFNAELQARGCFAGTVRIHDVPLGFGGDDLCVGVQGLVSSTGIAVCGQVPVLGKTFGLGAGYRWGGAVTFMAGACDVGPWRAERALVASRTSAARTVVVPRRRDGILIAVAGAAAPPAVELRGPRGERLRTPSDASHVLRTRSAIAFTNLAARTTYVLIAEPSPGRWSVTPRADERVTAVRTADVQPAPRVRVSASRGTLRYRVAAASGERVSFIERGAGLRRSLGVARSTAGQLALAADAGARGRRTIEAMVERDGIPRRTLRVASYLAPGRPRPARPRSLVLRRSATGLDLTWSPSAGAARYAVRVALPDGRRLFFLRTRGRRSLRLPRVDMRGPVSVRVVGLRDDNVAGPAALVQETVR